jgi:hypothetical protein
MKQISYSLFGTQAKYYIGAEKNLEINKILLPDWQNVIYFHPSMTNMENVEKLNSLGASMVDVTTLPNIGIDYIHFPYFWRFLSFFQGGISISRDLDSRVSMREVNYINKWLDSNKDFFIIRDHPWHSPVPAGLIGMRGERQDFVEHFVNFVNTQSLAWGADQTILHEFKEKTDENMWFYCGFNESENYIPRDDQNFFIGMQIDENDNPLDPSAIVALKFLSEMNL